jgi:general secretion pathway protein J
MRCRSAVSSSSREGFLLIEALATLAISAVILTGLTSTLSLVLRDVRSDSSRVEDLEQQDRAVAALRRDLQNLARARWLGEGSRSFVFDGEPDRLIFAIDRLASGALASTVVVNIQSTNSGVIGRLLRTEAAWLPGAASLHELRFERTRVFYEGRLMVRLAYFARLENGAEAIVDVWQSPETLPSAIRIGLVDPISGSLVSSVRVPIQIDAEPGCAASENTTEKVFCSRRPRKPADGEPVQDSSTRLGR